MIAEVIVTQGNNIIIIIIIFLLCNFQLTVSFVNLGNSQIQQGNSPKKAAITTVKETHFRSSINEKQHRIGKSIKGFFVTFSLSSFTII